MSGFMQTCEVCYEEYSKNDFTGLSCEHLFCVHCVTDHITTNISSGNAVRIRCMKEGCQEVYTLDTIQPFVTPEQLKVFEAINADVRVGKNKRLKWCSTNNCDNVIKRPGCCCKKKTLCTTCGSYTCFKCGKPWH